MPRRIMRFDPKYWTCTASEQRATAITPHGTLTMTCDWLYYGDYGALTWTSRDFTDHADVAYEEITDYTGLRWRFHLKLVNQAGTDEINGGSLTITRNVGGVRSTRIVRLSNYLVSGTPTDGDYFLDFDNLYSGWDSDDPTWAKIDPTDIESLFFYAVCSDIVAIDSVSRTGNVVTVTTSADHNLQSGWNATVHNVTPTETWWVGNYGPITVTGARTFTYAQTEADDTTTGGYCYRTYPGYTNTDRLPSPIAAQIILSGSVCEGTNAYLEIGDAREALPYGMALGYGDTPHLTPERIIRNCYDLGYRDWLTLYVGYAYFHRKVWDAGEGRFVLADSGELLSGPARAWFGEFYAVAARYGYRVVSSISYDIQARVMPYAWSSLAAPDTLTTLVRNTGVVTATTDRPHLMLPGRYVKIAGVADSTFDEEMVQIVTCPSADTFTYVQAGADDTSTGGTVQEHTESAYNEPMFIVSPGNEDVSDYLGELAVELTGLAEDAGAVAADGTGAYVQVGEPWWWSNWLNEYPAAYIATAARAGNVVTLTTTSAHGVQAGHSIRVADVDYGGATGFNGVFTVVSVGAQSITYAQTGENGTATAGIGSLRNESAALVQGGKPLLYDARTLARYTEEAEGTMPEFRSIHDDWRGHESAIEWLRDTLGASILAIRDAVKTAYPQAQVTALPYLPGILGYNIGFASIINWPAAAYTYPALDFLQVELYWYVMTGDWSVYEQVMATATGALGYDPARVQYFAGYVGYTGIVNCTRWGGTTQVDTWGHWMFDGESIRILKTADPSFEVEDIPVSIGQLTGTGIAVDGAVSEGETTITLAGTGLDGNLLPGDALLFDGITGTYTVQHAAMAVDDSIEVVVSPGAPAGGIPNATALEQIWPANATQHARTLVFQQPGLPDAVSERGWATQWDYVWTNMEHSMHDALARGMQVTLWAYAQAMAWDWSPLDWHQSVGQILAQGMLPGRYRVLTTALQWPAGDPPFPSGDAVAVPALPDGIADDIAPYSAETFNPAAWTNCTALVSDYRYTQDASMAIDQLSLVVHAGWRQQDLDAVFGPMRVIVIQERHAATGEWATWTVPVYPGPRVSSPRDGWYDTGWQTTAWCLSDGVSPQWMEGRHTLVVNAKDALKLANLDPLDGVHQADLIQCGTYGTHQELSLVAIAADAYEYGLTTGPAGVADTVDADDLSDAAANFTPDLVGQPVTWFYADGTRYSATITEVVSSTALKHTASLGAGSNAPYYIGAVHPNWADLPAPMAWVTNARTGSGGAAPAAVPVTYGGDAVQAVFGEGVLRIGDTWAHSANAQGTVTDYQQGLNIAAGVLPTVEAVLYRWAHPETTDRDGQALSSDVSPEILYVVASSAGTVELSGLVRADGQSLTLQDGSDTRYTTEATGALTRTLTLTSGSTTIPVGTPVQFGEANRARDLACRLLTHAGFQRGTPGAPLYLDVPGVPEVAGADEDIILPPLRYEDTGDTRAVGALDALRSNGYVPPNWITRANRHGQIVTTTVQQLAEADAIDIRGHLTSTGGLTYDANDLDVATRVVARGLARQLTDHTQLSGVTVADVAAVDGGLPAPAYTISGQHYRPGASPAPAGFEYDLDNLLMRDRPTTTVGNSLHPWLWWFYPYLSSTLPTYFAQAQELRAQWRGAHLLTVEFPAAVEISAVELSAPNSWWSDTSELAKTGDIYQILPPALMMYHHADPQTLALDYWDVSQQAWRPLVTSITTPIETGESTRVLLDADDFVTRAAVETTKLRLTCLEPFFAEYAAPQRHNYNATIGVYLWDLKAWSTAEIRGVAELGSADNYGGELAGSEWQALRSQLRRRTYVLPEAVPWANTEARVKWLALEWLKSRVQDLAPRRCEVLRPDIRLYDTVYFAPPGGTAAAYLVTAVDRGPGGLARLTCVNYDAPYQS